MEPVHNCLKRSELVTGMMLVWICRPAQKMLGSVGSVTYIVNCCWCFLRGKDSINRNQKKKQKNKKKCYNSSLRVAEWLWCSWCWRFEISTSEIFHPMSHEDANPYSDFKIQAALKKIQRKLAWLLDLLPVFLFNCILRLKASRSTVQLTEMLKLIQITVDLVSTWDMSVQISLVFVPWMFSYMLGA